MRENVAQRDAKDPKLKTLRHDPKIESIKGDGKNKGLKATEEGYRRGKRIKSMESQKTQEASLKKLQAGAEQQVVGWGP